MKINDPAVIGKTPIITTIFLCWSNFQQLWQMWTEHTSAGQSLSGWVTLGVVLWLFLNFYRVCCPKERFIFWGTVLECVVNVAVIFTVIWFRYFVR
jgi:hypothetical protein